MVKTRRMRTPRGMASDRGGGTSQGYSGPSTVLMPRWAEEPNAADSDPILPANLDCAIFVQRDVAEAEAKDGLTQPKQPSQKEVLDSSKAILLVLFLAAVVRASQNSRSTAAYRPSFILDMLVPYDRAQDMHANLGELYPVWVSRHGAYRAEWVRRAQVALLIGGTWWEKLLSTGERLLKVVRLIGS